MRRWLLAALLANLAACTEATPHPLPLWQLDGAENRVYLLGSVHLLREQDYPIPETIYSAYADAETIVMELDLDDLDPVATQALVNRLGSIQDGGTLGELLGDRDWQRARRLADDIGISLEALMQTEPWLAAISVEQMMLNRIGFDPAFGIEAHLLGKASTDGKEIVGLEDMAQQLGFLDSLSLPAQRDLLLQTLDEATGIEAMMDQLIDAWRRGDVAFLKSRMLADMQQYPELYDALVVGRNRDWARQIEDLLDDEDDYLIVVGALHLVGEDSVLALLSRKGHAAKQLQERQAR